MQTKFLLAENRQYLHIDIDTQIQTRTVWATKQSATSIVCLNSVVFYLLKSLEGILIHFHEGPFSIAGDIQTIKDEKCAQQFPWRNGDESKDIDVNVMTVMTFGTCCSHSKFV